MGGAVGERADDVGQKTGQLIVETVLRWGAVGAEGIDLAQGGG
ncbi:hypothetical protein ACWZEH_30155 [Streptomyces sp. QTS137]